VTGTKRAYGDGRPAPTSNQEVLVVHRREIIPGANEFDAADAAEQHATADRQPEPPTAPEDLPLEASEADAADQTAEIALDEDDERH